MSDEVRLIVDRPRPDEFEYRGVVVRISYGYADNVTDVPFEARVTLGSGNAAPIKLPADGWNSYEQARSEAAQAAKDMLDKQLG